MAIPRELSIGQPARIDPLSLWERAGVRGAVWPRTPKARPRLYSANAHFATFSALTPPAVTIQILSTTPRDSVESARRGVRYERVIPIPP